MRKPQRSAKNVGYLCFYHYKATLTWYYFTQYFVSVFLSQKQEWNLRRPMIMESYTPLLYCGQTPGFGLQIQMPNTDLYTSVN